MTKLWRVPGVNMELHTAETCDRPGAYLVAHLPETERPLTIRALKRLAAEHDTRGGSAVAAAMSPADVLGVLETMPLAQRFGPRQPSPMSIDPPTAEEVERIHARFTGESIGDGKRLLRDMLRMFVDMRNAA